MEEHEVKLVLEKDGWQIYEDSLPIIGKWFEPKDRVIAKSEAKDLAKKLSLCEFIIVDATGMELLHEKY